MLRPPARWASAALAIVVFAADCARPSVASSLLGSGVLDEIAHLATGALVVWSIAPASRSLAVAVLAASVLIDVDHIPGALGWNVLTVGTPRPYTHALWLALLLLACAGAVRRPRRSLLLGAAIGVAGHLWRDLATGAGVSLLWPLTRADGSMHYSLYAVSVIALALLGARRAPHGP